MCMLLCSRAHNTQVEVKRQLMGVRAPSIMRVLGPNMGPQAWYQVPLPSLPSTDPSFKPKILSFP